MEALVRMRYPIEIQCVKFCNLYAIASAIPDIQNVDLPVAVI